jgi:hypothetical protein
MRINRGRPAVFLSVAVTLWVFHAMVIAEASPSRSSQAAAAASAPPSDCPSMESFLKKAKIVSQKDLSVGVTIPSRATLVDGTFRHDASVQTVDVKSPVFQGGVTSEVNFRDTWEYNVAGYELAKLLKLNMVPPYVERKVRGKDASVSWWIDDAMMEKDRYKKNIQPPDSAKWNNQMFAARVFHELIADTDFNMTNVLITKDWSVWLIDFSRAFRMTKTIRNPKELTKVDRTLLANLRTLDADVVRERLGRWVGKLELDGLLARRDLIVQFFEKEIAAKGEAAVLYDFPRTSESCGAGLQ